MKIIWNAFLLWILFCSSLANNDFNTEESDFYESLTANDITQTSSSEDEKRESKRENYGQIYKNEVKILGHIDNVARENGITEKYIDPTYHAGVSKRSNDDQTSGKNNEIEENDLSENMKPLDKERKISLPNAESDSDIGTGIEVESEEKLNDKDNDELHTTSQSGRDKITSSSSIKISGKISVTWPSGTYGLPMTKSGCPESSDFRWKTGARFYDTEDDENENFKSSFYNLAGNVNEDGVTLQFCLKTEGVGEKRWPPGKYCVYKKGGDCPQGLLHGTVYWDDENNDNKNYYQGELPDGVYTEKTKISFCCSTNGTTASEIILPTSQPFYLFPFGTRTCQKVKNTKSSLEFVKFDEEDKGGIVTSARGYYPYGIRPQEKDHIIYLCYYEEKGNENDASFGPDRSKNRSTNPFHGFIQTHEDNETGIAKEQVSKLTVKKSIELKTSTFHAIIIASGFVVLTVAILVGALLVISYFTKRWSTAIQHTQRKISRENAKNDDNETNCHKTKLTAAEKFWMKNSKMTCGKNEEELHKVKSTNCTLQSPETDTEHEELVEDGFFPEDSQLKSGLEFLFLKHYKKKWIPRKTGK